MRILPALVCLLFSLHSLAGEVVHCANELSGSLDDSEALKLAQKINDAPPPINFCNQKDMNEFNKNFRSNKDLKKQLRKQCKQKAKDYKKTVAKKLLKDFKLGRLVQVAFKRKKDIYKTKISRKKLDLNVDASKAASPEAFSAAVMEKIREQVPNLNELMAGADGKSAFQGAFDQDESFPVNMVLRKKGGNYCVVNTPEFPEEEFEPEECETCKTQDLQSHFSNDCSYMVGEGLTESQARSLMGASSSKSSNKDDAYCNQENVQPSDFKIFDKTIDKLCVAAQEDLKPDFKIETSRNLYNDHTKELAAKRGEFTQKYLFQQLQKKCQLEEQPAWLSSLDAFEEVVQVTFPEYKRPGGDQGDYGPSPYAKGGDQDKEKEYLAKTLQYELEQKELEIKKRSDELKSVEDRLSKVRTDLKEAKTDHASMSKELSSSNVDSFGEQKVLFNRIMETAQSLASEKKALTQKRSDLQTRIASLKKEKSASKYQKEGAQFKLVKTLDAYYKDAENSNTASKNWDKLLFNQFKMAKISGEIKKENEFGIDESLMTPELKLALNALLKVDSFTCELEPIKTHKTDLNALWKAPLKIATIATLPVLGTVGAVGAVAVSPITSLLHLFCRGCREPGSVLPKIGNYGNVFAMFNKSNRREGARNIKGFVKNYVKWGGILKLNKKKHVTEHDLNQYAKEFCADEKNKKKPRYQNCSDAEQEKIIGVLMQEAETDQEPELQACLNSNMPKEIDAEEIERDESGGSQVEEN